MFTSLSWYKGLPRDRFQSINRQKIFLMSKLVKVEEKFWGVRKQTLTSDQRARVSQKPDSDGVGGIISMAISLH